MKGNEREIVGLPVPATVIVLRVKPQAAERSPLSPHWAFVVQFREETDVEQGRFAGRVEHVVSRQATHFHSLEELLAFIVRVLAQVRSKLPEEP